MASSNYNIQLPGSAPIHDQIYPNLRTTANPSPDAYPTHTSGYQMGRPIPQQASPVQRTLAGAGRRAQLDDMSLTGAGRRAQLDDMTLAGAGRRAQLDDMAVQNSRVPENLTTYSDPPQEEEVQLSEPEVVKINHDIDLLRAQKAAQARPVEKPVVSVPPKTTEEVPREKEETPKKKEESAPKSRQPSTKKTKKNLIVVKKSSPKKKNDYGFLIVPLIAAILFLFFFHPKTAKFVDKYLPPGDSTKGILIRTGIVFFALLVTGIGCKVFA